MTTKHLDLLGNPGTPVQIYGGSALSRELGRDRTSVHVKSFVFENEL